MPGTAKTQRLPRGDEKREDAAKGTRTAAGKRRGPKPVRKPPAERLAWAAEVWRRLTETYPDAHCELDWGGDPYRLLVAVILSAQCTDKTVNRATPALFARFPSAADLARGEPPEIESLIRTIGLYRNKAKAIREAARRLVERHGGAVPRTMEELTALPGVGRKTANVVLGDAFGASVGVVTDTHVIRLSQRIGLSRHRDPAKLEADLMRLFPPGDWRMLSHRLIFHGRRICFARKPECWRCPLADVCRYPKKTAPPAPAGK
jgi:endonuclease-3